MTSEDIKHQLIIIIMQKCTLSAVFSSLRASRALERSELFFTFSVSFTADSSFCCKYLIWKKKATTTINSWRKPTPKTALLNVSITKMTNKYVDSTKTNLYHGWEGNLLELLMWLLAIPMESLFRWIITGCFRGSSPKWTVHRKLIQMASSQEAHSNG